VRITSLAGLVVRAVGVVVASAVVEELEDVVGAAAVVVVVVAEGVVVVVVAVVMGLVGVVWVGRQVAPGGTTLPPRGHTA
jgi:hypothetical protein